MVRIYYTLKCLVIVTAILLVTGCATMKNRWETTTSQNNITAYEQFLKKYPDGAYSADAHSRLEKLYFEEAISAGIIWKYESFLKKYPDSEFTDQIRARFAKVVIDFLSSLKSRSGYYNIVGPVWVFNIKFKEINGVGAKITKKKMKIYAKDGKIWGDYSFNSIHDSESGKFVQLNLRPNGTASYKTWVNDPSCNRDNPSCLRGAKMVLEYKGKDDRGHAIKTSVSFILE